MESAGSQRIPAVEHARVSDAMNTGIVACSGDAGLREVTRSMSSHHIHRLYVTRRSHSVGTRL